MRDNDDAALAPLLEEAETAAAGLARTTSPTGGQDAARHLLRAVYRVGLAAGSGPARPDAEPLRSVLLRTAPLLAQGMPTLSFALHLLENRFHGTWEWDWEIACEARSAFQFLLDLYRGTGLEASYGWLDTGEVDDQMRFRGERDGFLPHDAVPEGIPPSHWWWWAPDAPPSDPSHDRPESE